MKRRQGTRFKYNVKFPANIVTAKQARRREDLSLAPDQR